MPDNETDEVAGLFALPFFIPAQMTVFAWKNVSLRNVPIDTPNKREK